MLIHRVRSKPGMPDADVHARRAEECEALLQELCGPCEPRQLVAVVTEALQAPQPQGKG
jgi:hypothetical protein